MTKTEQQTGPKVYGAIAAVMADLAAEGITKSRKNQQQGYNFRGIDDVYNALSPFLSKHGLVMLPKVLNRETVERQTKSGGALFYVTVEMEFALVASADGSTHTVQTYGEAMDSGDKATNKAMSAAYKYAAMQTFCIPTEGDNDADGSTHEVKAANTPNGLGTEKRDTGPGSIDGKDWWGCEGAGMSPAAAKRDPEMQAKFDLVQTAILNVLSESEWRAACREFTDDIKPMPRSWRSLLRADADSIAKELNIDLNRKAA